MSILRWLLVVAAVLGASAPPGATSEPVVAVTTIIEHPALGATRRGLEAGLSAAGLVPGETLVLIHRSAHGSRAEAHRIARELASLRPDVIVSISTPSAQAVAAVAGDVPVVFAAVSDPLAARLVDDLTTPGGNVVGVSDRLPLVDQLDLIEEILPEVRRLGVILNPQEAHARSMVTALERHAGARGIEVIRRAAVDSTAVQQAGEALASEVGAFYVPPDNTVVSALEDLVEIAVRHRVPVFGGDIHMVPRGALAALGFNYFEIGRQAAELVQRVIAGEPPGAIPVQNAKGTDLYVNLEVAARLGLVLPDDVVKRARQIVASR